MSMALHNTALRLLRPGRALLASSNETRSWFRPTLTRCSFASSIDHRRISRGFSSKETHGLVATKEDVDSPFIRRVDRSVLRPSLYHVNRPNESRVFKKSRLCPTRDLNFTPEMWARHKAPGRHIRHLLGVFSCASFQRLLFPDLFLTASVAAGLTYYNVFIGMGDPFSFDKTAFTSCSMAISVLAGFRLNTSYDRFSEARRIMGQVNNASRDLMGQACMFLNDENKERMRKLLKAFSVALHFHLNIKGGYYKLDTSHPDTKAKVQAAYRDEMREIFFPYNDDESSSGDEKAAKNNADDFEVIVQAYESGSHVPLLILSFMRNTIIKNEPPINPIYGVDMGAQVSNLTTCLGGCERILRTPVPATFTANTSRLMSLWSLTLPLALYPLTGSLWTLPFSVIFSYVVLSIEDIGAEIEEPFHVLPLRQYTEGTADSLDAIVKAYDVCPTREQSNP